MEKNNYSKIQELLRDRSLLKQATLIDKIQEAAQEMVKDVSFDDEKHIYTRTSDGQWLQGVSTVSSIVPKNWLPAWGAKEAVKFLGYSDYEGDTEKAIEMLNKIAELENNVDDDGVITKTKEQKFIELLKEAKGASFRKSKEALIDGSAGHEWLEIYVKARINGSEIPALPEGNLLRPIQQFLEWEKENIAYWILSEQLVANPEHLYAGTLDAVAMMTSDKLALIDFKFSSHISEDYYLQTAGYQFCFEKYGISIDERTIIRLPKTLEKEEWDKEERKYKKVKNDIEIFVVPTPYENDVRVFLHCLPLKGWINAVQNNKLITN